MNLRISTSLVASVYNLTIARLLVNIFSLLKLMPTMVCIEFGEGVYGFENVLTTVTKRHNDQWIIKSVNKSDMDVFDHCCFQVICCPYIIN